MGVESMFLKFQIYRIHSCEIDYVRTNIRDLPYGGLELFFLNMLGVTVENKEHMRSNTLC